MSLLDGEDVAEDDAAGDDVDGVPRAWVALGGGVG